MKKPSSPKCKPRNLVSKLCSAVDLETWNQEEERTRAVAALLENEISKLRRAIAHASNCMNRHRTWSSKWTRILETMKNFGRLRGESTARCPHGISFGQRLWRGEMPDSRSEANGPDVMVDRNFSRLDQETADYLGAFDRGPHRYCQHNTQEWDKAKCRKVGERLICILKSKYTLRSWANGQVCLLGSTLRTWQLALMDQGASSCRKQYCLQVEALFPPILSVTRNEMKIKGKEDHRADDNPTT